MLANRFDIGRLAFAPGVMRRMGFSDRDFLPILVGKHHVHPRFDPLRVPRAVRALTLASSFGDDAAGRPHNR